MLAALLVFVIIAGCSLFQKSGNNKQTEDKPEYSFTQNLTARYNILYNAHEMIKQEQEQIFLGAKKITKSDCLYLMSLQLMEIHMY